MIGLRRRIVMLTVSGALLAVVAAGYAVPPPAEGANDAIPALAVAHVTPDVDGVAYGSLPEQVLDVHLTAPS